MDFRSANRPVVLPLFSMPQQPDLNWRNPAVEKAMFDVTRWWYKRGVSGFRLDAVDTLFEDPKLERQSHFAGHQQVRRSQHGRQVYNNKLPEMHGVLQRLRKVADENEAVLIGETWTKNIDELKRLLRRATAGSCRCRWI